MTNLLTNTAPEAVRAPESDFPAPRLHITEYGFKQATCVVCGRHFLPAGYKRHYKQAHLGIKPNRPERIRRHPSKRPARPMKPCFDVEPEPAGEWYWKKMSQESIARILASYPR